jgi:hypothetical protein
MDADSSLDCTPAGEIHSSVGASYGNAVVIGALSRLPSVMGRTLTDIAPLDDRFHKTDHNSTFVESDQARISQGHLTTSVPANIRFEPRKRPTSHTVNKNARSKLENYVKQLFESGEKDLRRFDGVRVGVSPRTGRKKRSGQSRFHRLLVA